jgi:hypothetical protein
MIADEPAAHHALAPASLGSATMAAMAVSLDARLAPCLALCVLALACGDTGGASEGADTSSSGSSTGGPQTGSSTSSTGATETEPTTGAPTTGTTADETSGGPVWDGEPLPDTPPGEWTWVAFPEAMCRDGSPTGIGVRRGSGDGLVMYFEGGGACFNALTCPPNPAKFDEGDFADWVGEGRLDVGLFATDADLNPLGDWSFVYFPYCTGDVFAGNRPDQATEFGVHQFVGHRNVTAFLERIVPTFAGVGQVLATGVSAGGFGAGFNYDRIAAAFPDARVTLLDDSAPPLGFGAAPLCLQQQWSDLWGFDDTLPAGCEGCFPSRGGGVINIGKYIADKHPDQRFGLVSSMADETIRLFFGFGINDCKGGFPELAPEVFAAELLALREDYIASAPAWGTYFIDNSSGHVWTVDSNYYTMTVGGTRLVDWVAALIGGTATHVGP